MTDDNEEIHQMARRIQAAILPVTDGQQSKIVVPAMVQTSFARDVPGRDRAVRGGRRIIALLGEAKRSDDN